MDEPMARDDDLAEKPFDPEMTESDEANAPDDTGRTAGAGELSADEGSRSGGEQDEVGI